MTEKRWQPLPEPQSSEENSIISSLETALGIDKYLSTLLWQRGVNNFEEAKAFFRPSLDGLHDPFLMKDMEIAVERLIKAIETEEKIVIYGDYDVDGTTAVALVYGFLNEFYSNIEYYNPDRYKEGYGISDTGIDWAESIGATLIIALDCGIKSIDKVDYAAEKGIDFIICDHHEPGEEIPKAVAVLDPKRVDCKYPFKELTGNGVGFKLLTAYCIKKDIDLNKLYEYLDFAMVSIASDIVPIIGENRILAFYGLKKINDNPRIGLKALKEVAGSNGEMNIENVVFTIGPRINAAGRIKHAKAAVQLLLASDYGEAMEFAYAIQEHNLERRTHDARITEEALTIIKEDDWLLNEAKSTVLFRKDWHKGVIGIVASRCIEHYYRPTVIFTKTKDGMAAGSARSVSGFNLYEAVESCSPLLEQFGGHMHAAGMTIPIDNIPDFRKRFNEVVSANITAEQLIPQINIDLKIKLEDLSKKFYRVMKQMGPFGPKNMHPIFQTDNLTLAAKPRILKEKHLKLELVEPETGTTMTALGFGMKEPFYDKLLNSDSFKIVYTLEENTFRNQSTLQLFLKDIKF
ncbi:single-stranded-DNA-specific exonuclease RecJ [Arcticibacterium luteifluviistationis]|uniref:Single-stranded-DNA-specific exonuclease RecJ n=1 Tax=Arcticibacterium luteifluviistationis TaxID=1784714 RepID=A0A2Z4GA22_9BACT|nr:single-stranded-DNA-specific exonuclease RecJ [Arcticibacterium luteifluviistationis]AWV97763.1 single-stranded-DNA-specific exonuclease RecJ [Arcticibacterium luteifluviistationis]